MLILLIICIAPRLHSAVISQTDVTRKGISPTRGFQPSRGWDGGWSGVMVIAHSRNEMTADLRETEIAFMGNLPDLKWRRRTSRLQMITLHGLKCSMQTRSKGL